MRAARLAAMTALALLLSACAAPAATAPTPEPTPTAVVTPEPTPEPTPTPTPEPTPRPLLPVELCDRALDPALFAEASEQGRVELVEYPTADYTGDGAAVTKTMAVYLPYGYDPAKRYDVLFLLHTAGGDERTWLVRPMDYIFPDGWQSVSVVKLLDNAIQQGRCAPLIVAAPSGYVRPEAIYDPPASRYEQFSQEFARDILPFLAENFATYAASGEREDLRAARSHFGVLGASYGAYLSYLSILGPNMDLAASYCMVGGGEISAGSLAEQWSARGFTELGIELLYFAEGEYDDRAAPEGSYIALHQFSPYFSDDNLLYTNLLGTGHEAREWVTGLYNSLQLFFRED